jgi:hypothetical protein
MPDAGNDNPSVVELVVVPLGDDVAVAVAYER